MMSTSDMLNIYLEIEDNFVVPEVFSCVLDFILTATGLFSVASRGLFAPNFLSKNCNILFEQVCKIFQS